MDQNREILIVEISGKRPGNKEARPTEKIKTKYDHLIISNNSEGYDTEWDIVNVPDEYKEWYVNNVKCSENAWYAPMNRSYAIKYAREHGYKYLVQLDDNIVRLEESIEHLLPLIRDLFLSRLLFERAALVQEPLFLKT